jgi:hypothetical protein
MFKLSVYVNSWFLKDDIWRQTPKGRRGIGKMLVNIISRQSGSYCELCNMRSPLKDCMTLTLVVGLARSNESRSYAGGSVATGRVSHARLVCDEDPE